MIAFCVNAFTGGHDRLLLVCRGYSSQERHLDDSITKRFEEIIELAAVCAKNRRFVHPRDVDDSDDYIWQLVHGGALAS